MTPSQTGPRLNWFGFKKVTPNKEASGHPKAEAKAKAWEAKTAVPTGVHSHTKKEDLHPQGPPAEGLRHCGFQAALTSWEEHPGGSELDRYTILKFPLTTESATEKTGDNTLVVTVMARLTSTSSHKQRSSRTLTWPRSTP